MKYTCRMLRFTVGRLTRGMHNGSGKVEGSDDIQKALDFAIESK